MDDASSVDTALAQLGECAEAVACGDWPKVDFLLGEVRQSIDLERRVTRRPYDVEVAWRDDERVTHREFVRTFAASRVLAHDVAQSWARHAFELPPETRLVSRIDE